MKGSDKIKKVLAEVGLKPAAFARAIGLKAAQNVYDIQKDKADISKDVAQKIISVYPDFRMEWLLTGEGEMLKQHTPPDRDIPRSEERGGEILSLEIIKKLLDEREKERADWQENIKRLEERISMLEKEAEDKGTSIPDKEMPLSRT